jgi:hypothetical protein
MDNNLELFTGNPWNVDLNTTLEPLTPPPPCPTPKTPPYPCGPTPPYPVCPPGPEPEVSAFINKVEKERYDRAFITVDTLEDLVALEDRDLHDGKLVRVQELEDGQPGFVIWDAATHQWLTYTFSGDILSITDEEIDEICV